MKGLTCLKDDDDDAWKSIFLMILICLGVETFEIFLGEEER